MDILSAIQFSAPIKQTKKLEGYGSLNYKVTLTNEAQYLVKIFNEGKTPLIEEEERIINGLHTKMQTIQIPACVAFEIANNANNASHIRVTNFIEGTCLHKAAATDALLIDIAEAAANMQLLLGSIESPVIKAHEHDWNLRNALRNKPNMHHIPHAGDRKLVQHFFACFEHEVLPNLHTLRHGIIHGDLNEANIIIQNGQLQGFIDFGDISYAPVVCELAILLTYIMMMFPEDCMQKAAIIIKHYQNIFPLTKQEIELLPVLIATRLCVSVCNSAAAKALAQHTDYILISEQPAWHLLKQWITYNPIYLQQSFMLFAGFKVPPVDSHSWLQRRKKVAAPSLSLSYNEPIHMSASLFQYMYDKTGNAYLDAYNNIPHVGHAHPAIIEAATTQMRKLNTNTRYIYNSYITYSENLLTLFPKPLEKAMLVNSGSEASDLASRIARTITGKKGIAVLEWSYHGNTQNGIYISSYKFDRKGGAGAADFILRLPLPKAYNAKYNNAQDYVAEAKQLIEAYEQQGKSLAAFIAEPVSGCGGQVPLIENYLKLLTPYLRSKGILVIIDEVQTGFGRMGSHFWGFEMHGIVPDIVVLGKPIANGHPMGAVVTTEAITHAFNNGMEFFSSFGGNPVSCAIGNAVIKVIKEEALQQQANETGNYWMEELRKLQPQFPLLGNVRGAGLFVGVECITEDYKENTAMAQRIKDDLKNAYILASTDGPLDNTLKMKPPLCFSKANVDRFMEAMYKSVISLI
jgi:ethanolamine-phosphate phospho-lyase